MSSVPSLSIDEMHQVDAWWRACNYLVAGQIYLQENPLLKRPLTPEDIKPRLLGHWGTSAGLGFIYAHLNRLIRHTGQDMIYIAGPGHGGPALVAAGYLEGTYTEIYPRVTRDEEGMRRLFRQFSTPGGIPSHASVTTPGSIHEGGELGYALSHGFGAVFDNPDLIAATVVGDGEAETGPAEGGWKGISFLNPVTDGAVLPILHLNGAKISGPTVQARKEPVELQEALRGPRLRGGVGRGQRPALDARPLCRRPDLLLRPDQGDPGRGTRRELGRRNAGMADDHPAQPQGLDRTPDRRRQPGGGHLACPPGTARGRQDQRGPS